MYLDDILVYRKTRSEHLEQLDIIFKKLHEEKLMINLDKFEFIKIELVYLGFVLAHGQLKMC